MKKMKHVLWLYQKKVMMMVSRMLNGTYFFLFLNFLHSKYLNRTLSLVYRYVVAGIAFIIAAATIIFGARIIYMLRKFSHKSQTKSNVR